MKTQHVKSRPILVWVIGLVYIPLHVLALLNFAFDPYGDVPIETYSDPAFREFLESTSYVDELIVMFFEVLNLLGGITLLLMRRVALYFLIGGFVMVFLNMTRLAATTNATEVMSPTNMVLTVVLAGAIAAYTWHLNRQGRLH